MNGIDIQNKTTFTPITKAKTKKVKAETPSVDIDPGMRIDKVYRRRGIKNGKTCEFISWITEDGKHHGLKVEQLMNKEGLPSGKINHFTVDYDEKIAKQLIDVGSSTNPDCRFYIKGNGATFSVTEIENFTKDFGELIRKGMKQEII